ncbi:PAS domain-containing protein [Archaeoglobus sp.]
MPGGAKNANHDRVKDRTTLKVTDLQQLQKMFENEIIYVLDPQGRIIDANRTALETFGYSREDLGNISIKDIVERRCLPATVKEIQRVVETGVELKETSEVLCKTKEEKKIWIEAKLYPILKNGKIIAIYGTAKDVTLKKKAGGAVKRVGRNV